MQFIFLGAGSFFPPMRQPEHQLSYAPPSMVKALLPMGRKGKAQLVLKAENAQAAKKNAATLLGRNAGGFIVKSVLIEELVDIGREFYVSFSYDSRTRSPVMPSPLKAELK